MSLPRDPKKSQPPWLDLAVFGAVVAFLGYSLHAFLGAGTRAPASPEPAPAAEASLPLSNRRPASQVPVNGSTEVVRVPCLHEGARTFTSGARLVQIHSTFCGDDSRHADANWRATNESSGEEILVFVNAKEKSFSTSYFALREGANELVFVEEIGRGQTRREKIKLTRKPD